MNTTNSDILLVIFTGLVIGVSVLLLVANELGKRAGLSFIGRSALVGGLGLGVIAFSIKAGLVIYLDTLSPNDIAVARSLFGPPLSYHRLGEPPWDIKTTAFHRDPRATWRALPRVAPSPVGNLQTPEKIELGRKLFFDTSLSINRTVSCASCHRLGEGGDDNLPVSQGIRKLKGNRNAPTVLNAAFLSRLFWDGRAASLEAQALGPLVNPVEMGMPSFDAVVARVEENPEYVEAFSGVFGDGKPITINNIAKALAAFERTLITPQSPYDRFIRGEDRALTPQQLRGMALFATVGCRNCHLDPTFSSAGKIKPFGVYRTFPIYPNNALIRKHGLLVDGKPRVWRVSVIAQRCAHSAIFS